jgi:hypothetical protein
MAVIVVGRDVRHVVVAQNPEQAAGDRRLSRAGVAHDPDDDRARH